MKSRNIFAAWAAATPAVNAAAIPSIMSFAVEDIGEDIEDQRAESRLLDRRNKGENQRTRKRGQQDLEMPKGTS